MKGRVCAGSGNGGHRWGDSGHTELPHGEVNSYKCPSAPTSDGGPCPPPLRMSSVRRAGSWGTIGWAGAVAGGEPTVLAGESLWDRTLSSPRTQPLHSDPEHGLWFSQENLICSPHKALDTPSPARLQSPPTLRCGLELTGP